MRNLIYVRDGVTSVKNVSWQSRADISNSDLTRTSSTTNLSVDEKGKLRKRKMSDLEYRWLRVGLEKCKAQLSSASVLTLFMQLVEFVEVPISRAYFSLLLLSDAMQTPVRSSGWVAELLFMQALFSCTFSETFPTFSKIATGLTLQVPKVACES